MKNKIYQDQIDELKKIVYQLMLSTEKRKEYLKVLEEMNNETNSAEYYDAVEAVLGTFSLAALNPGIVHKVKMGDFVVEMKGSK